jgi:hypothetical protein
VAPDIYDAQGKSWEDGGGWERIGPSFLVVTPEPDRAVAAMYRPRLRAITLIMNTAAPTASGRLTRPWQSDSPPLPSI